MNSSSASVSSSVSRSTARRRRSLNSASSPVIRRPASLAGFVLGGAIAVSASAVIPPYTLVGQYAAPAGSAAWDTLPDGRVLFIAGSQLLAGDVRSSAPSQVLGSVPAGIISDFGASFISLSPDGSTLAIGDNNFGPAARVHTLPFAALSPFAATPTSAFAAPNFEATWADSSTLLVTGFGNAAVLTRIDTAADPALATRTLITHIGDGSGGVAIDAAGRVYVGLGFDASGGASTGQIRAFDLASLEAAPAALDFVNGSLVARALSAGTLGFDPLGNLLAAGGDFFSGSNDFGSAAVIRSESVAAALAGATPDPVSAQLRLSPAGADTLYAIRFNRATDELLASDGSTIFRYAVPSPASGAMLALGSLALLRRCRHA